MLSNFGVLGSCSPSQITALLWRRGLCNSMKPWAMLCKATQDGWVRVESSDKTWSTRGGNGKPLQYTCHENLMNCIKRQKDMTQKDEWVPQVRRRPMCYWGRAEDITNSPRKKWNGWAKAETTLSCRCVWWGKQNSML